MMEKNELQEHLGEGGGAAKKRDVGKIIRLSLSGLALVLLVAFCALNSNQVEVHLIVWSGQLALIWVIIISAILGAIAFGVVRMLLGRRKRRK
jgi:uncharacterized integral membrane protein